MMNKNSLTFFRLLCAFQVMFNHMAWLLELEGGRIEGMFAKVLGIFEGVPIFFALSGFLVWNSIKKSADFKSYALKRFYRIYPELWLAVILEIIPILIFYKGKVAKDIALFVVTQSTFLQFWTPDSLRGYGCGVPNGPLWTICVFVQFYIVAWWAYKFLKDRKIWVWGVSWLSCILVSCVGKWFTERLGVEVIDKLFDQTIFRYMWVFLAGMFVSAYFERVIAILKRFWIVFLFFSVIAKYDGIDYSLRYGILYSTFIMLAIIGFAYRFTNINVGIDLSFGLYIFHMIVVNLFINFGIVGEWRYMAYAMAITAVMAFTSYQTVGRFARKRKVEVRMQ